MVAIPIYEIPRKTLCSLPRRLCRYIAKECESKQFFLMNSGELLREKGFKCIPFQKIRSNSDTIKVHLFLYKNLKLQGA